MIIAGLPSAFDMELIFHSYANITHLHEKGCALSLILKVRGFGTRKWPISNVPGKSVISKVLERVIAKTSFGCPLT